jgi:hypothetical protein
MAKKEGRGAHWQPPPQFNNAPPTTTAPHAGTTHRDDTFSSEGNTNLKGFGGKPVGKTPRREDEGGLTS